MVCSRRLHSRKRWSFRSLSISLVCPEHSVFAELDLETFAECGVANNVNCLATIDLSHTALVTGLSVLDANGAVDPDVSFLTASGVNYNDIAPVPLPAAAWLMLGSLGLLGAFTRRKGS